LFFIISTIGHQIGYLLLVYSIMYNALRYIITENNFHGYTYTPLTEVLKLFKIDDDLYVTPRYSFKCLLKTIHFDTVVNMLTII